MNDDEKKERIRVCRDPEEEEAEADLAEDPAAADLEAAAVASAEDHAEVDLATAAITVAITVDRFLEADFSDPEDVTTVTAMAEAVAWAD